jgi:hypothetical protein
MALYENGKLVEGYEPVDLDDLSFSEAIGGMNVKTLRPYLQGYRDDNFNTVLKEANKANKEVGGRAGMNLPSYSMQEMMTMYPNAMGKTMGAYQYSKTSPEVLEYMKVNNPEGYKKFMREGSVNLVPNPRDPYDGDTSGRGGTADAKAMMEVMDTRTDEETVEELTLKQRMANLFNDADKRDAILGGIADAMLETRVGADAYGSRFARAQKNVRENLKLAEATNIARQQAQLDAMKTLAETDKLTNPAQYLTNAQKEADAYVRAKIATGDITMDDYAAEYAKILKQIAVKDLTSAKAGSIKDLFTYARALESTDPDTAKLLMDAIKANAIYLSTDGGSGGTMSTDENTIVVDKEFTVKS